MRSVRNFGTLPKCSGTPSEPALIISFSCKSPTASVCKLIVDMMSIVNLQSDQINGHRDSMMSGNLWKHLVRHYCVNTDDAEQYGLEATAGLETIFWFRIELPAFVWLVLTVLLPGDLPIYPTFAVAFIWVFSRTLRSHRASRSYDMQCTVLDTGASLARVLFSIPLLAVIAAVMTAILHFVGGLY